MATKKNKKLIRIRRRGASRRMTMSTIAMIILINTQVLDILKLISAPLQDKHNLCLIILVYFTWNIFRAKKL